MIFQAAGCGLFAAFLSIVFIIVAAKAAQLPQKASA